VHELGCSGACRMWRLGTDEAEMPLRDFRRMLGLLPPTVTSFAAAASAVMGGMDGGGMGGGGMGGASPQQQLQQQMQQQMQQGGQMQQQMQQGGYGQMPPPQQGGYGQMPPQQGMQPGMPPQGMGGPPQQQQGYGQMPPPPQQQQPPQQQPQQAPDAASLAAAATAALDRFFVRAADVDVEELLRTRLEATSLPPPAPLGGPDFGGAAAAPQPFGAPPPHGAFGGPAGAPPPNSFTAAAAAAVAKEKGRTSAPGESEGREGLRATRCTGSAMAAAVSLMACCAPDGSARAMVFCGGPSVGGRGAITGPGLRDAVRSHADIAANGEKAEAVQHYTQLGRRAVARGHALDVICAALDDVGLWEMRSCVQRTGGVALSAESFGAPQLLESLRRLLVVDDAGELAMGFGSRFELRVPKDCGSLELLGGGGGGGGSDAGAGADGADGVDSSEAAEARCFSWSGGCVGPQSCSGLLLHPASDKRKRGAQLGDSVVMQMCVEYRHAAGGRRLRVTTLKLPCAPPQLPPAQLLPALDQQAAAVLLTRMTVQKAAKAGGVDESLRWLDRLLIRLMQSLCQYRKGDPRTIMLPPRLSQLPGILFHLRRSGAIRTSGTSPDLTAAFRLLASSLSVYNTLVLVQPTLLGYDVGRTGATPLPLDGSSITPDRSLLLDSFRQVILCHSRQLAQAEKSKTPPEGVKAMFAQARADMAKLEADRFPAPEVIECEQYGSKARYLTQKLHSDVPLDEFLRGLYKAVVS
jgi:hypothetical protein